MKITSLKSIRLAAPLLLLIFWAQGVAGQIDETAPEPTPQPSVTPEVRVEEDPTRPVLFSLRNEYRQLKNDSWANTVIFRYDRIFFRNIHNKGSAKGLIFRFDAPLNTVHRGESTKFGLGDLYAQVLYIPRFKPRTALAVGSGIVFPTATNKLLGQGKLIIAPTLVPIWYLKRRERVFLTRFQNYISIAGAKDRPDVNYFLADPVIIQRLNRKWWTLINTEFRWDWKTSRGSAISGVQLGRMLRGGFGFWVKPEIPWGENRQGSFNLKFTVFRVR